MRLATILGALIAAATCFGWGGTAVAADRSACADLPPSAFELYLADDLALDQDFAADAQKLAELPVTREVSANGEVAHPSLVLDSKAAAVVQIDGRTAKRGTVYCVAPRSVRIGIGFARRSLHMLSDAYADTCARGVFLEHAARHWQSERSAVREELAEAIQLFAAELPKLKMESAPSPQEAFARFRASLQRLANLTVAALSERQTQARARINTADELRELARACDGSISRFDADVVSRSGQQHGSARDDNPRHRTDAPPSRRVRYG